MFDFNKNTLILATVIVFIILLFSVMSFLGADLSYFNWLSDIIYNTITPILNLLHHLVENIKDFFNTLFSIDEINKEINELRQKNSVLERQILFLENINRENQRLRELLNFKEKVDYQMVGAEVIANSPSIWEKVITINRGSKDGLEKRMPVISYDGLLVGRIEKLGSNSAQVRLITDRDFIVGGIVARTDSRVIGLVKGSGREDQPNLMDNIAWDADIKSGDIILTSGLSNNFPSGLKIGKVSKVETDNYGLSQKAEIDLYLNNNSLEEVMVIKNFNAQKNTKFNNQKNDQSERNLNEESEINDGSTKENEKERE